MRRRIILMGGKTHVISLPLKWIKKYEIKKGQELELEEKENSILVSTESKPRLKEISLNLTNTDTGTIIKSIVTCYQRGYNSLKITFDKTTINHKTKKEENTQRIIENTCSQLIGFEITDQNENTIQIKDITSNSINEFKNILRRTFLMLNTFGQESHNFLKNGETEENLHEKHINIRKYTNYCQRFLNIFGFEDKTLQYTEILFNIEEISRTYRFITKNQPKLKKESLQLLKRTIELQDEFYKLFYKFNTTKSSELIKRRLELFQDINTFTQKAKKDDIIFMQRLPNILNALLSLTETTISINFEC